MAVISQRPEETEIEEVCPIIFSEHGHVAQWALSQAHLRKYEVDLYFAGHAHRHRANLLSSFHSCFRGLNVSGSLSYDYMNYI